MCIRDRRGILEVNCLPDERRFDPPLLFDFRVEKDKPIIDEFGRIRYEVRKPVTAGWGRGVSWLSQEHVFSVDGHFASLDVLLC